MENEEYIKAQVKEIKKVFNDAVNKFMDGEITEKEFERIRRDNNKRLNELLSWAEPPSS